MNANLASIMPQAVGVLCEELGHDVRFVCYTGAEDLASEVLHEADVLFIGAFTRSKGRASSCRSSTRTGSARASGPCGTPCRRAP